MSVAARELPADRDNTVLSSQQPAARNRGGSAALDAVVLDASLRQALVATRSLGTVGLRVGLVENATVASPPWSTLAFASRWATSCTVAPDYERDPDGYGESVLGVAASHPGCVVIPCSDESLSSIRPWRTEIERSSKVALGDESALSIAVDKRQTLELARKLAIRVPATVRIHAADDIGPALDGVSYPLVVKPAASWFRERAGKRLVSCVVVGRREAAAAIGCLVHAGVPALVQPWLSGRREAVSLFRDNGRFTAAFAQATERTTPVLGGASVLRKSVPLADDLHDWAVSLVDAMNLDGYSDVEFRRDERGRPHLMEVNPRLSGSLELAVQCGVDFPLMTWRWAHGLPVAPVTSYRTGVRMRWLTGDLRWLKETLRLKARPDGVTRAQAVATFARTFAVAQKYDTFDARDPWPAVVELGRVAAKGRRVVPRGMLELAMELRNQTADLRNHAAGRA